MPPINLVQLIKGLVPIVLFAPCSDHLYELRDWAVRDAFKPWHSTQFFSAGKGTGVRKKCQHMTAGQLTFRPLTDDENFNQLTVLLHSAYKVWGDRDLKLLATHQTSERTKQRCAEGETLIA